MERDFVGGFLPMLITLPWMSWPFCGPFGPSSNFLYRGAKTQSCSPWNNSGPPHPSSSSWYRSRTVGDRLVSSMDPFVVHWYPYVARNFRSISTHHQWSPGTLCRRIKAATMAREKASQAPSVSYNIDVLSESFSRSISCCFSKRPCSRPAIRSMRGK